MLFQLSYSIYACYYYSILHHVALFCRKLPMALRDLLNLDPTSTEHASSIHTEHNVSNCSNEWCKASSASLQHARGRWTYHRPLLERHTRSGATFIYIFLAGDLYCLKYIVSGLKFNTCAPLYKLFVHVWHAQMRSIYKCP
jgi:hypothetical protein